eukprot:scaffold3630_cov306-Prasinococcus_capsulatus_cf.AAC.6
MWNSPPWARRLLLGQEGEGRGGTRASQAHRFLQPGWSVRGQEGRQRSAQAQALGTNISRAQRRRWGWWELTLLAFQPKPVTPIGRKPLVQSKLGTKSISPGSTPKSAAVRCERDEGAPDAALASATGGCSSVPSSSSSCSRTSTPTGAGLSVCRLVWGQEGDPCEGQASAAAVLHFLDSLCSCAGTLTTAISRVRTAAGAKAKAEPPKKQGFNLFGGTMMAKPAAAGPKTRKPKTVGESTAD